MLSEIVILEPDPEDGIVRTRWIMKHLSRALITAQPGDRFVTLSDLQKIFGVGAGTVQAAIRSLETLGAIALKRSGHQGTTIVSLDYRQLWHLCDLNAPIGAFAPISLRESVAAFDKLQKHFDSHGLPIAGTHLSGARERIDAVRNGKANFAIVSADVSSIVEREYHGILNAILLPNLPFYYVDSMSVIALSGEVNRPIKRVAYDAKSQDHEKLTRAEFIHGDDQPELVECRYLDIPKLLLTDKIDAAVWHEIDLIVPFDLIGIKSRPLKNPNARELFNQMTKSAAIVRSNDQLMRSTLGSFTG